MFKVTVAEQSLMHSGELMEWVFRNCPSYCQGSIYKEGEKHYYNLYFSSGAEAEWFTLKWFEIIKKDAVHEA